MYFTKMHGLGNDFILINDIEEKISEKINLSVLSKVLCSRHFGIGGDGLILISSSKIANFKMRIFNPDGTEAEMCGNGIRCFAKYVYEKRLTNLKKIEVETLAGIIIPKMTVVGNIVKSIKVDMGVPKLKRADIPMRGEKNTEVINEKLKVEGKKYSITCVSLGNPHCVLFEENIDSIQISKIGPLIENHNVFPKKANVEFVRILNPYEARVRVWERGAGETLACGTGACAAVVAGVLNKVLGRKVTVHLPGGKLLVEWTGDNRLYLEGPAEEVFSGEWKKQIG